MKCERQKQIQLLESPIPAPAAAAPTRHKKRHMAISREPSVVPSIRWCQNDRKKFLIRKFKKKKEKNVKNDKEWSKMV